MSFSYETKKALCKLENKKICCERAEGYALLLFSKFFKDNRIITENKEVIRRISEKTTVLTGVISEVQKHFRRNTFLFSVLSKEDEINISKFFMQTNNVGINHRNIKNQCCEIAFLRGAFLACGTVSDPSKQYHLEFVLWSEELAVDLYNFVSEIEFLNVDLKYTERNNSYILYLSDSEQIEEILTYIGAQNSAMEIMQTKMYKEMINNINRKSNFETANIDKSYSASAKQIAAINYIIEKNQFESIDEELKKLAMTRLENPQMSLKDLAEKQGLSRSAVNHRLNKIINISEKIKRGE